MRIRFVMLCVFMASLPLIPGPASSLAQPSSPRSQPTIKLTDTGFVQDSGDGARKQNSGGNKLLQQLRGWKQPRERKSPAGETGGQPASPPAAAAPDSQGGGGQPASSLTAQADAHFRRLDRNGDGLLSYEEMTENLKLEREKWDANQDGQIDLDEWRAYVSAFNAQRRKADKVAPPPPSIVVLPRQPQGQPLSLPGFQGRRGMGQQPVVGGAVPVPGAERKMFLFGGGRAIPPWFNEYDTDGDGQVSLDEWTAKNGTLQEFREIDQNGDGFMTDVEVIRAGKHFIDSMIAAAKKKQRTPRSHPDAQPDPGNLTQFRGQIGSTHLFEVTGSNAGGIWGTDIYTDDSPIAIAAVHVGALSVGQKGVVRVTILQGMQQYSGSTRNGVNSGGYGPFGGSYTIQAVH